ncbi:hypothetical protein JJQ97_18330 [Pseudomonas syringae]|uniref:hypothetical protein n=1 Tax=Pseudomonas syringae TaxID=317 RepID=UPI00191725CF|nr:hypothetical protein [Pseudomonas syringae]QQQ49303.1 hypothetical protein JJQ97_18330 [Pseudomonas syringae]
MSNLDRRGVGFLERIACGYSTWNIGNLDTKRRGSASSSFINCLRCTPTSVSFDVKNITLGAC